MLTGDNGKQIREMLVLFNITGNCEIEVELIG
jgi:hypothetical protein